MKLLDISRLQGSRLVLPLLCLYLVLQLMCSLLLRSGIIVFEPPKQQPLKCLLKYLPKYLPKCLYKVLLQKP